MTTTKILTSATARLGVLILLACAPPADEPEYVARIGDHKISVDDFERRARRLAKASHLDLDSLDMEGRQALLDDIIAQELILVEGMARGYHEQADIADEVLRLQRKRLMDTLFVRQAHKPTYTFTDEQVTDYYRARELDVEVRTEQIVCDTRDKALEVLRQVQGGGAIRDLVYEYTVESVRRRFGPYGDIGWFSMADMLPELKAPIRQMQVGDLHPEPVPTALGHHVFRLKDRRAAPLDSVRARIVKELRKSAMETDRLALVNELRRKYAMQHQADGLSALLQLSPDQDTWDGDDVALVTWTGGALKASDFLAEHQQGHYRHPASQDSIGLAKIIDNLAGQRIMATEARQLGYDTIPDIAEAVDRRLRQLIAHQLFRVEGRDKASPVSEAVIRAFYDGNIDRYTTEDGTVTDFEALHQSIRRQLTEQAQNEAMDEFLSGLRAKYEKDIEFRPEALEGSLRP